MNTEELTSFDVARRVIYLLHLKKLPKSHTKIQKLVYIIYGSYLYIKDEYLFTNERPKALPHGPVFLSLYNKISKNKIKLDDTEEVAELSEDVEPYIIAAIDTFGTFSAKDLVDWLHRDGTAWKEIEKLDEESVWGKPLLDGLIKAEFHLSVRSK